MKFKIIATASALTLFTSIPALAELTNNQFGIEGTIATSGAVGAGLVDYTNLTEIGFTIASKFTSSGTSTVSPSIFAGLRKSLLDNTWFAYGIDAGSEFGSISDHSIHANYSIGPYVSIEQAFTKHVLFSAWINPYTYQYQRIGGGGGVSTNGILNSGGIGINYLF